MMKPLLVCAALLAPTAALADTFGDLSSAPKPMMLWSYTFSTTSDSKYDLKGRTYKTCTYVGWKYQTVTKPAVNGRCPLVHVEKPQGD